MSDFIEGDDLISVSPDGELVYRKKPFLRTRFNYDTNRASVASSLACSDPTRAQQNSKDECDINTIVRNFGVTGQLPNIDRIPLEGDFHDVVDYQTALHALMQADETFMQLPSDVRKRFDNDPSKFVSFATDESNRDELKAMGLLRPETPLPAPIEVRVIPDPSDPSKTPPTGSNP